MKKECITTTAMHPMKEAAEFARYYYNTGSDSYVVWGLGLGYHIRELLSLDSNFAVGL